MALLAGRRAVEPDRPASKIPITANGHHPTTTDANNPRSTEKTAETITIRRIQRPSCTAGAARPVFLE